MKKKGDVMISEGMKPLWQRIIAALLYTLMFYLIINVYTKTPFLFSAYYSLLIPLLLIFSIAFPLSAIKNYHFDFDAKKFKVEYVIGYLKYGVWEDLPKFEYVSVFMKGEEVYELNLWFYKNEHYKVFHYFDFDDAILDAFQISEKLQIDLLDASVKNNHRWIDKDTYRETKEIKYID
ncbi:MAG: hypothetical protein COA67_07960 [Lutibacter sp.]|nr:MAG: hypothetical protein COA67_07960 [Lutibacter sp.]